MWLYCLSSTEVSQSVKSVNSQTMFTLSQLNMKTLSVLFQIDFFQISIHTKMPE